MIDNIKHLWSQVDNKTKAIKAVSEKCGKKFGTVKVLWLAPSGGFSIPDDYQGDVVDVLQRVVKEQELEKSEC